MSAVEAIETVDLTARAVAGGWVLPDGWTVRADMVHDGDVDTVEYDCYTATQEAAWHRDDWTFVTVSVWVQDEAGREWGHDSLGAVEAGSFPLTDEDDNVTGSVYLNPLADAFPLADHDMIGEALRSAVAELARFGTPVITEPDGITVTGL